MKFALALFFVGFCSAELYPTLGGYTTVHPGDDVWGDVLTMADFATATLSAQKNKALGTPHVVHAMTQLVSGMNYALTLRFGTGHDAIMCNVTVYDQPWTKTREITSQVCSDDSQAKRQFLAGGYRNVDPNDPTVLEMAKFATTQINAMENGAYEDTPMVMHAATQVVAGMNYKMTLKLSSNDSSEICTVVVWSQPWSSKLEMTESHCHSPQARVGEPTAVNSADANVQMLATMATQQVNAMSNNMFTMSVQSVSHVTQQLVAGLLYKFELHLAQSTCIKGDDNMVGDPKQCPLDANSHLQPEVWSVSGLFVAWQNPQYQILDLKMKGEALRFERPEKLKSEVKLQQKKPKFTAMDAFKSFKQNFNKTYSSIKEEKMRYLIFEKNMRKAAKIQAMEKEGSTARYGPTMFADLTEEEFSKYKGFRRDLRTTEGMEQAEIPGGTAPVSFDWRDHGAVTEVKNQGSCGSCWAFSTTGNIEGQWKIKKGALISLSEQELVDCDKLDEGCNGGLPSNAYKEIIRLGGLETEKEYAYEGEDEKCHFIKKDVKVYINSSVAISQNETDMAAWLAKNGPISIGINAMAMQFYMGGISHPWEIFCSPKSLDHGVLIVGYGVKNGTPYWIIKNSWGSYWGEKGYYLVYRGSGVCGLNQMCTSAVVN